MSRVHEEQLAASSKTTHSHSGAVPWNNFNPSFSLSRDSAATDDDTTVTKEGWNSDPNCYSPQLGSYAQETLLVNTSLSNTQLQAALWTKWGSRKESERRKWGSNPPVAHSHPTTTAQQHSRSHCQPLSQQARTHGGKTPNAALQNRVWVLRTSTLFCCYGYFLCGKERITGLFLYRRFSQSEPGRKRAHEQMWNKFKALNSGNTCNMTLFLCVIPIYTFIHWNCSIWAKK